MSIASRKVLIAALVALVSSGVNAAEKSVNPDQLPEVNCSSLHYSAAFLNRYPKAPAACLEARVYKGETYMKVKGTVYVLDYPAISFAFADQFGNTLGTVTVSDPKSLRVIINGKEVSATKLRLNEALTFWVPQSLFGANSLASSR
jgi:hypothetical protein